MSGLAVNLYLILNIVSKALELSILKPSKPHCLRWAATAPLAASIAYDFALISDATLPACDRQ